ncbi:MAG: glucoamylase family protein [Terracidiphilus sp.]
MSRHIRTHAEDFYIGGILVLSFIILAFALFPALPHFSSIVLLVIALLGLLPPAMQDAVELVNQIVTTLYDPEPLPKLDFAKAIPKDCATVVVVPSLLFCEEQVRKLVTDLEVRYLANREPRLHFALLTDLPDSVTKPREQDSQPLVELAVQLIGELNAKYGESGGGSFVLLHRDRIFNKRQGVWMSWERKRGKLLDLNNFLTGEYDAFAIKAGPVERLQGVRYVLTLDSDTQLPRGTATRLIGAMAHPLNQAVIDPKLRIVTSGYGILQPRVGVAVRSIARSRLAAIFSGQSGFDMYTRAVSDAYQDLFGEGLFTGKGIYEVEVLHSVLNGRFPRNALLSHDLIEGAYARAGLVTDVEIIDDYPSHYSAYSRRQHRWMRGDWQILQWAFSRVPNESGVWGPNPISAISRWKIFDNLRRSLVEPALLLLLVAGWMRLPGGALYWTIVALALLSFPIFVQLVYSQGRALASGDWHQCGEAFSGFGRGATLTLLHLVLLFHQTLLTLDAVFRSLVRRFITGERLLEWESAAQSEMRPAQNGPVDRYQAATPLAVLALAVVIWRFSVYHDALFYAAPLLVAWALSTSVSTWLNQPPRPRCRLDRASAVFLLSHALRTWRYFAEFSSERHHYLIPDNVAEDGRIEAARVSPTNIGLLLNARQTACELGFLTIPEFAELTNRTLSSIASLEKFRGHLCNWYDTETLSSLGAPPFVSSVDSGNFLASLYTLRSGACDLRRKPLFHRELISGVRRHWQILREQKHLPAPLSHLRLPGRTATMAAWIEWLPSAEIALCNAAATRPRNDECAWWLNETSRRVSAMGTLLRDYLPWLRPEFKPLRRTLGLSINTRQGSHSIEDAIPFAEKLSKIIAASCDVLADSSLHVNLARELSGLLPAAQANLRALAAGLQTIEQNAERLAEAMDFSCLVYPGRHVLSIGYDTAKQEINEYCYELFASEARLATFLAIARDELSQQGWLKLEREHAFAFGQLLPLSWTGTMFEYLMPGLWMHSHHGTLAARTEAACVEVQRAFARRLHLPWGISESGSAQKNDGGDYCYHAYGIPQIALSPGATAGPVISPYSTFLALDADPFEALQNLRRMESAGWVGPYGFYEAADFSSSLRTPTVVRQWMAHHEGMSLLAITNLLHDNVIKRWFHANPMIQASEMLLHELPPSKAALRQKLKAFGAAAAF